MKRQARNHNQMWSTMSNNNDLDSNFILGSHPNSKLNQIKNQSTVTERLKTPNSLKSKTLLTDNKIHEKEIENMKVNSSI